MTTTPAPVATRRCDGFGDTQSIAIGIDNNGIVGPGRTGPRNQRRSPMVLNAAFYPALMWNSRFAALSTDPFDNRLGFQLSTTRGSVTVSPAPPARGAGVYPSHRAGRGGRIRISRRQRRHSSRGAPATQRHRRLTGVSSHNPSRRFGLVSRSRSRCSDGQSRNSSSR